MKKLSLKEKILGLASIILSLTALLGVFAYFNSRALERVDEARHMQFLIAHIQEETVRFRVELDTSYLRSIEDNLVLLKTLAEPYVDDEQGHIILRNSMQYALLSDQLVKKIEERGLTESVGLEGEFRNRVHAVEERIKGTGSPDIEVALLTARRGEKDYLLRRQEKYVQRVHDAVQAVIDRSANANLSPTAQADIKRLITLYEESFNSIVLMLGEVDALSESLDRLYEETYQAAQNFAHDKAENASAAQLALAFVFVLTLLLGGVLAHYLAGAVSRPVVALKEAANAVAAGRTDIEVAVLSQDEIGALASAFNTMVCRIQAAQKALVAEKEGMQVRVEEAVAATEAQRQYLEDNIHDFMLSMERFAGGDLSIEIEEGNDGDIALMYRGFNKTVSNIRAMFTEVMEAVEATTAVVTQIGSATEELAAGAEEQSSQTSDVAAGVEEMAQTIITNACNANQTADAAARAGDVARGGGEAVHKTIDKIRQLAEVIGSSSETVEQLGASGNRIGEIVAVIDDIADQTNLLALNAAIEAARAGEQGRGFAVVADEVRKLAERTTQATRQIAQMIEVIQQETEEAVKTMRFGREEMALGLTLADQAGEALERVVTETDKVIHMINQIAVASEEQSVTSEEMSRNVEAISTVADESAQGLAEIAQSTEVLSQTAGLLRQSVLRFKVQRTPDAPSSGRENPRQDRQPIGGYVVPNA